MGRDGKRYKVMGRERWGEMERLGEIGRDEKRYKSLGRAGKRWKEMGRYGKR